MNDFKKVLAKMSKTADFRDGALMKTELVDRCFWSASPQQRHWDGYEGPNNSYDRWCKLDEV